MWGIFLSSLYHPRVNKNRFLIPYIYMYFKCPTLQYHCSPDIIGVMKLLFYLGSYFQVCLQLYKRLPDVTSRWRHLSYITH